MEMQMKLEGIEAEGGDEGGGMWDEGWLGHRKSGLEVRSPSLLLKIEAAKQNRGLKPYISDCCMWNIMTPKSIEICR